MTPQYDLNPLSERSALLLRSSGDSVLSDGLTPANSNSKRSELKVILGRTMAHFTGECYESLCIDCVACAHG